MNASIDYRKDYEEFVNLKRRSGLFISIKPSFTMLVDLISCGRSVRKNKCGKESEKVEKEVCSVDNVHHAFVIGAGSSFCG
ncbi:hypothetical protein EMIT074MI3_20649 [Bacillus licheniformis]|nr:hypothetical protein BKP29_0214990 [Bacillus licheniformis]TWN44402.1 hypothetical protein CHCC14441_3621 [Bacillus licheniformis]